MRITLLRTLQGKFTLYLSLLILVIMSGLAYRNISGEKNLMEEAIVREGTALVESFAISCTNTLLYEEIGLVEEGGLLDNYISDLMQRKDLNIVYAMILDQRGKVIAHSSVTEVGNVYEDAVTRQTLISWDTLVQAPSSRFLDISAPLAISTKRWGTLRIGISLENLKKDVSRLIWKNTLYAVGLVLLVTAAIALLFGLITNALKSLSREMDMTNTRSDISPKSATRQDEIGVLQKSFYNMLKRIKDDEKERERTQRNLLLTEKMVAIGKLTAGMAHEINNPLAGVLNCIYHFKKGALSTERQQEYLGLMEDGIGRIQKTVSNLLEYARNPGAERSPVNFGAIIEKSLSLLDFQIRKHHIQVKREIPRDLPPIKVNGDQMGQVLVNILLNAIQAMQDGGILGIRVDAQNGRFTVTILDTGKGIPNDILQKVFDPFFTTKGEGKGTGLGLWVSQIIVEQHGGTISLSSQEGKGTTVEIHLPLTWQSVS